MNESGKMLSLTECLEDIDTLVSAIESIHPNPYFYNDSAFIEKRIQQIKNKIPDSIVLEEFYVYLSYLAAGFHDGHIAISFPESWNEKNPKILPFSVKLENGEIITTYSLYEEYLPEGAEIIQINNINSPEIYDTMISCQSGESRAFREARASKLFNKLYCSIYNNADSHLISFEYHGKLSKCVLKAAELNNCDVFLRKNTTGNDPGYAMELDKNPETCIIYLNSFSYPEKFSHFIDSAFRVIKNEKVKNLIIDLRNNPGGNCQLGDELFQYISHEPFGQFSKVSMKVSRRLKSLWNDVRESLPAEQRGPMDSIMSNPAGKIIDFENIPLTALRENPLRFDGEVYLLTSPRTYSAAADFACCFKYFKMGKIVGEETGGWVFSFGEGLPVKLPNSNITSYISSKLFYNIGATEKDFHGVRPDIQVKYDEALKYSLNLIENKN